MYVTDSLIKFWFNVNHFQTINSILSYAVGTYYYGSAQSYLYRNTKTPIEYY